MASESAILQPGATRNFLRLDVNAARAFEISGNFLAQGRNAARGAITIASAGDGAAHRIYNGRRGVKIGSPSSK